MYTKVDLIENKKMDEIIKANRIKVRQENIKNYKKEQFNLKLQGLLFGLLLIASMVIISLIENMNF